MDEVMLSDEVHRVRQVIGFVADVVITVVDLMKIVYDDDDDDDDENEDELMVRLTMVMLMNFYLVQ